MQKNYPGRLYRFFGIELGLLSRGFWAIAHRFVDDFTKKKITIYGDIESYRQPLLEIIPPENLEKKFGG
jgi:hypothetical protein